MLEFGWIKLSRKITKWRWYKDGNTFRLFMHLILTANHEDCDFETITIHRGQRVASRRTLSQETGLSEREIRTAISHLISTGELTSESRSKYTIFTINNYNSYQITTSNQTSERPTTDQQSTSDRPQCKKDKKDKESKEYLSFCTAEPEKFSTAPTLEEVQHYAEESGISVDAARFFEYYQQRGWRTKNGDAITDWKRTMQFWESREGKGNRMKVKQEIPKSDNADAYKGFIYNMDDEVST